MSEFYVHVVQLGRVGKHPNADSLSITTIYGYPVVFKTGDFLPGDLAVRIPIDAVVDTRLPAFSWLADKAASNHLFRVKGIKIRNVPSYGFLVPVSELPPQPSGLPYAVGQDVSRELGVSKYDPGPCYSLQGAGDLFTSPDIVRVPTYDIEGLRKYAGLLKPGEPVVITEKIHGANGRWVHFEGQSELLCGSRTKFRKDSVWNRMAEKFNLGRILSENKGLVLYGEVYGPGIQDLHYGLTEPSVLFFDAYDTNKGIWADVRSFIEFCADYLLPAVPVLYDGPYDYDHAVSLAEGKSTLCNHVREGVVIKPVTERWDQDIGRVFLKLPGEGYLLRKGNQ